MAYAVMYLNFVNWRYVLGVLLHHYIQTWFILCNAGVTFHHAAQLSFIEPASTDKHLRSFTITGSPAINILAWVILHICKISEDKFVAAIFWVSGYVLLSFCRGSRPSLGMCSFACPPAGRLLQIFPKPVTKRDDFTNLINEKMEFHCRLICASPVVNDIEHHFMWFRGFEIS